MSSAERAVARATERASWAVALAFLALSLHGLGTADIVGDDEAREAGLVQEIVAGDWLLPRFNGAVLPDKPLLYHWLAAVPCALGGFSELNVRLPSALAGAATVLWTARFGTRLFGAEAGLASAIALATMPAFFDRTRTARPDVLLVLLLSLALGQTFLWWRDDRRSAATLALAWLGAATLAKGPVAPALFALTVGGFLVWERAVRRLAGLVTLPGLVAFGVLGLGWYVVALAGWGHLFVAEHLVGRYAGNVMGGFGAAGYVPHAGSLLSHLTFYPLGLLAIALPATPLAGLALRRETRGASAVRFLCCWAAAPVVAFVPVAVTLRYYLLPALPAAALLAGPPAVRLWRRGGAWPAVLAAVVFGVVVWCAVAVPAGERRVSATDSLRPFAAAVAAHYPAPTPVAFYGPPVPSIVVYLGRHVAPLGWRRERITTGLAVIAREPDYRDLAAARLVGEPLLGADGRVGNRARGRMVLSQGR